MNALREHTLLVRLSDRPGAMEAITSTFAHRGISLTWTFGNDGSTTPDGQASVIVHFRASQSQKETMKRVLSRLSRITSVHEPTGGTLATRLCALVRLCPESLPLAAPSGDVHIVCIQQEPESGETIYSVNGPPEIIDPLLSDLQRSGAAKSITRVLLAL